MNKFLFNPFRYVAGWESLLIGIIVLLATSVTGYYSHIHFPDLLSVKTHNGLPYPLILAENGLNWLIPALLFYITALIFSPSSVRAVDVFGTMALARWPYFLVSFTGFSDTLERLGKFMVWKSLNTGEPVSISTGETLLAGTLLVFTLLSTIWMVALMVNAFKVSANLKGTKLTVLFIVILIISAILTAIASHQLLGLNFQDLAQISKP
jgi:hypothetical protein